MAVVAFAGYSVGELFAVRLGAPFTEAALAVAASVGVCVAVLFIVLTTDHAPLRGLGAIVLIAWSLLVLALVGLNSALRGGLLAVPDALVGIGRVAAALLAGAALAPAIVLPIAAHDRTAYPSAAAAASKFVGFAAKGVGIGASVFASSYFGIARGLNPFLAVLCGFVLESCFVWAYLSLTKAKEDADLFDVGLWGLATAAFGAFIAAVSVETLSALAGISVPVVSALGEVGSSLYVSAVGLSLALTVIVHVLTSLIDIGREVTKPAGAQTVGNGAGVRVVRPAWSSRIANRIRDTRAGAGEIASAWRGEPAPALPIPKPAPREGEVEDEESRQAQPFGGEPRATFADEQPSEPVSTGDERESFDPRLRSREAGTKDRGGGPGAPPHPKSGGAG